jgi:uncharacterized membrane protein
MMIEFLALVTAFLYGCSSVFVKLGLVSTKPSHAVLVSSATNFVLLWSLFLLNPDYTIEFTAILWFSIAAILASFLGRMSHFRGIERVGVSINSSIVGSSALFSALSATLFLGENFGLFVYIGVVLVISGIILLSFNKNKKKGSSWKSSELIWSFLASICYGTSVTVRKIGLNIVNQPFFGATVGITASTALYSLYFLAFEKSGVRKSLDTRSLIFFILSGVCTSIAWILSFMATSMGAVTIVSALVSSYPLFSIILSRIVLKEEITAQIVLSSLLIIFGVAIVSTFS